MTDKASDFNYTVSEHCDVCNSTQTGTMHHCNDAMGIATPVLWTCARCENPPVIIGWYREAKRLVRRGIILARWYMKPKAERDAHTARIAKFRARAEARRTANV